MTFTNYVRHYAQVVTKPTDGVEVTWTVPYRWTKPIPATELHPPEGGLELDGDVYPTRVDVLLEDGNLVRVDLCAPPSEEECWEAIMNHNDARLEEQQ